MTGSVLRIIRRTDQENGVASRLGVGLFHSTGIAEDVVHRLMTEKTAMFVRALTDEQVELAVDVLKQYVPITIEVVSLAERPETPNPR